MKGGRKLTAWFWIFGFCAAFTLIRLVQGWFQGGDSILGDLPNNVVDLVKWSTFALVVGNVVGDHFAGAIKSVGDAVTAKKNS